MKSSFKGPLKFRVSGFVRVPIRAPARDLQRYNVCGCLWVLSLNPPYEIVISSPKGALKGPLQNFWIPYRSRPGKTGQGRAGQRPPSLSLSLPPPSSLLPSFPSLPLSLLFRSLYLTSVSFSLSLSPARSFSVALLSLCFSSAVCKVESDRWDGRYGVAIAGD